MSNISSEDLEKIVVELSRRKIEYLKMRGSSFDRDSGELLWAKDDAEALAQGIDFSIKLIKNYLDNREIGIGEIHSL